MFKSIVVRGRRMKFSLCGRPSALVPLLGLILAVPAVSESQKAMKLTAQDYIDIEQIVYRYANALDHCADNGNSYAGLFVVDGEFGSTPNWDVPPIKTIKGHDALALVGGGTGP